MEKIYENHVNQFPGSFTSSQDFERRCRIDCYVSRLFLQIGMPPNLLGFRFLREAVVIVVMDPSLQKHLIQGLYPKVAQTFNTTVYRVEHSMRCAVSAVWERGNHEAMARLPGIRGFSSYDKPSNSEFIALLSEIVRLRILEDKL